jgi:hypothetical protein
MSNSKEPLQPADVITWLGSDRVTRIEANEAQLDKVCRRAPNVPTAAIWLLQACQVMPDRADLKRWSADVRALTVKKPAKPKPPPPPAT